MRYRLLEHTADALIEAYGESLSDRFASAAYAMFDQITDVDAIGAAVEVKITITADNRERLLVDFLQELLYLHDAENLVFSDFDIDIDGLSLRANARGEEFDPEKHSKKAVVKGITYHELKIDDENKKVVVLLDV